MSYDLYFFKKENEKLIKEEIENYFKGIPRFSVSNDECGDTEIFYNNEDTGVYFSFSYTSPSNIESGQELQSINGFSDTGLTFNINFNRPTFFALEAMPYVEEVSKRLDLLILDPQANENEADTPQIYTSKDLIDSWTKSNKWAVGIYRQKGKILYLPYKKSISVWKYQIVKSFYQEKLGDGYFAPKIFIVKDKLSDKLLRVITWNQAIPQIIPECDYVLILREKKKFFGLKKELEKGIIDYKTLTSELSGLLEPFGEETEKIKILHPNKSSQALDIINLLKIDNYEFFHGVGMDQFVDI